MSSPEALLVVDARTLADDVQAMLRPGETVADPSGTDRNRPCWFYVIETPEQAQTIELAPRFALYEFLATDVREADAQRAYPRYLPLATATLAAHLAALRAALGTYVHLAVNGGYRTPAHRASSPASPHAWGAAANIYRIGDDWMTDEATIGRYADLVRATLPGVRVRPYGTAPGHTLDHLHLDLGYTVAEPLPSF